MECYEIKGKNYYLKDEPMIASCGKEFFAKGENSDSEPVIIYWDIREEWLNASDEEQEDMTNACDWDNPSRVELV